MNERHVEYEKLLQYNTSELILDGTVTNISASVPIGLGDKT